MTERIDTDELVTIMAFIISRLRRGGMSKEDVLDYVDDTYELAEELFEGKPWVRLVK